MNTALKIMNDIGKCFRKAYGVGHKIVLVHAPTQATFGNVFLKIKSRS